MTEEPSADQSSENAPHGSTFPALRPIRLSDPLRWLAAGWQDFKAFPQISLFYGLCFVLAGASLLWSFHQQPAYLLALAGSFLLLGPFLCLGMYDVSRKRERGQTPTLAASLVAWRTNFRGLGVTCALLLVLEMLWSRSALVIFAVAFNTIPEAQSTVDMLFHPKNFGFIITYLIVGFIFANLIYSTTVVALPMLIDRDTDSVVAGITSFRACVTYPMTMLIWAMMIVALVIISALPALLGLLITAPVLGHASWHAYRAIVEAPDEVTAIKP